MCDVLDVPRSTYYKAMDKTISNRDQENHDLTGRILEIYEEVNHVQYINYKSTELALFQYIEGWYNRKRIHGSIGYKTPREMEELHSRAVYYRQSQRMHKTQLISVE